MPVRTIVERGPKGNRAVAFALDWPGWSRGAKTPESALELLGAYRERYRPIVVGAGMTDELDAAGPLDVELLHVRVRHRDMSSDLVRHVGASAPAGMARPSRRRWPPPRPVGLAPLTRGRRTLHRRSGRGLAGRSEPGRERSRQHRVGEPSGPVTAPSGRITRLLARGSHRGPGALTRTPGYRRPIHDSDAPDLDRWEAWTPWEAAERFAHLEVPWCVVGGWAIDLFIGEQTREHGDLEVELLRLDFGVARAAVTGFDLFTAGSGRVRALGPDGVPPSDNHQVWVLDVEAQVWRIDVMLVPGDADTWVFRRDESITALRRTMVGRDLRGVPYLAPHGTLLYKAKAAREKDEADLEACLPRMDAGARAWLRDALARAHPGHPWIGRLT